MTRAAGSAAAPAAVAAAGGPHLFAAEAVVVVLAFRDDRLLVATEPAEGRAARRLPRRWLGPDGDAATTAAALLKGKPAAAAALPADVGPTATTADDAGPPVLTAARLLLAPAHADPDSCDLQPPEQVAAADRRHLHAALDAAARLLLRDPDVAVRMLPSPFTLRELRRVHELLLDMPIDPSNFNKRVLASVGFLDAAGRASSGGRPATTYTRGAGLTPAALVTSPPQ